VFFQQLAQKGDTLAAIDGGTRLSYRQLADACAQFASELGPKRQLIVLKAHNSIATLVAYLAALTHQHPVLLVDPQLSDDKLDKLIQCYGPNVLIDELKIKLLDARPLPMAEELSLLLSTSGTTGSAKQVALSALNLQANAASICAYLPIQVSDKTITTLPFFYSYGLSVINSHLLAGACIVFNQYSLVNREFWQVFKQQQISSFAGVPHSYDLLLKLRFTRMDLPSLRYFTQAGGKLSADKVLLLAEYAKQHNKAFYVMYGQTEASARMAYLSPEKALCKPDAIGQAIPQGQLILLDEQGKPIHDNEQRGELCYQGDNVMLGYAESAKDLGIFSPPVQLHTGDLAYRDEDGDFIICGRLTRLIKLFGQRINLDEVETLILTYRQLETYCCGDDSKLLIAAKDCDDIQSLKAFVCTYLNLHHSALEVRAVTELPISANGKKDYQRLMDSYFSGVLDV
jgi:long-chain acyl-CoA synthetase